MQRHDGTVMQIAPPWSGELSGFTLLSQAFVLPLAQEMPFTVTSRISGLSAHRSVSL